VDRLIAVRNAARTVANRPGPHLYDDFAIFNGPCRVEGVRQLARTFLARVLPGRLQVASRRQPAVDTRQDRGAGDVSV
jgi:hypothetical protein